MFVLTGFHCNSWKGCSVLNLVQWNLYSTDTSIQRTKNLVPEECSHCLCIATSIEGSWRDISVQGKNTFCGPRDPGLTSIQGTRQNSKSDRPQKSLISALVTLATAFKTWTMSPKSKIDVLHLWEFNTQHRRVASRPPPVTTESVCISLHVLRGHEGRFFSDCFGRLYAPHFRHYWPFLWSMDRYLLKKGHAKRGLPTSFTVNYDNNDILQTYNVNLRAIWLCTCCDSRCVWFEHQLCDVSLLRKDPIPQCVRGLVQAGFTQGSGHLQ